MARPLINLTVTQSGGGAAAPQPSAAPATESPQAAQPTGVAPHPDSPHAAAPAQRTRPAPFQEQATPSTRPPAQAAPPPAAPLAYGVTPHPESLHADGATAPPAPLAPPPPPPPPPPYLVVWQLGSDGVWRAITGPQTSEQAQSTLYTERLVSTLQVEAIPVGEYP